MLDVALEPALKMLFKSVLKFPVLLKLVALIGVLGVTAVPTLLMVEMLLGTPTLLVFPAPIDFKIP